MTNTSNPAGAPDMTKRSTAQDAWSGVLNGYKKPKKTALTTDTHNDVVPIKKIIAWNVNGLRALLKKEEASMLEFLSQEKAEILCLSETKLTAASKAKEIGLDFLTDRYPYQYWNFSEQKKGYSGTCILSSVRPLRQLDTTGLVDGEGRVVALEFPAFILLHTYVPNAGMKLERLGYRTSEWDVQLRALVQEWENTLKPVIWCGDLNVAHDEIDLHNPKGNRNKTPGFTDAERQSFSTFLDETKFVDVFRAKHAEEVQYTYWSYRNNARAQNKGWRLDYFLTSPKIFPLVVDLYTRAQVLGSDHCPIVLELIDDTEEREKEVPELEQVSESTMGK